jgi:hypothetical protein
LYSRGQQQQQQQVDDGFDEESLQVLSSEEAAGEQHLSTYDMFPALLQPSADGIDRGPDICIVCSLDELPVDESAHLANKGKRYSACGGVGPSRAPSSLPRQPVAGSSSSSSSIKDAAIRVHVSSLSDGTLTVEVGTVLAGAAYGACCGAW